MIYHNYYRFMEGWGFFMMLLPLLLIGLIIYVVYQLGSSKNRQEIAGEKPEDILDKRFARGEISEEEYNRMKDVLKK